VAGRVFDLDREMGFRHEILYDEPTVLCGRAEHPAFKAHSKAAVKLKEIAAYPWILPPPTVTLRREIETALSAMPGVKPPLIVESMSVLANRTLLLHTDMLTFTAPTVVAESVADGSLVTRRLPFAFKPAPIGITSRADHDLQPAAVLFVDALRGAARAIRNGKGIR
jgi:DNA-binding transcriptional LysR family regulator